MISRMVLVNWIVLESELILHIATMMEKKMLTKIQTANEAAKVKIDTISSTNMISFIVCQKERILDLYSS
jgi:hypothetical protein